MKRAQWVETIAIFSILVIAAYLRMHNVSEVPGWHNDEGTVINIAHNLSEGRLEYFGIQDSLLITARQPLFVWILSLLFRVFGTSITVLRLFTGILGALSTLVIFSVFRKKNFALAAICAFAYAIMPDAVITSRIGFSYNLASFLGILGYFFAASYYETGGRGYGIASALILGLGLSSELAAIIFLPALLIIIYMKRRQDLGIIIFIFFLPVLVYSIVMLFISPNAFFFDLQFIFFRINNFSLPGKAIIFLINIASLSQRIYFSLGLIGLLISENEPIKKITIIFTLIPFFVVGCSAPLDSIGMYKLVPLYPFFAIGIGLLFYEIIRRIHKMSLLLADRLTNSFKPLKKSLRTFLVAATDLAVIFPFILTPVIAIIINYQLLFMPKYTPDSVVDNINQISPLTKMVDNIFNPVLLNVEDATAVVNFVNNHTATNDLVIASPAIGWAIHANATDYVISLAYTGKQNLFFPTDIPRTRFRFNADFRHAKYIIVDNIWKNSFELNMPAMDSLNNEVETMTIAYRTSTIIVYQRQE
ncbi:MAG: glycosyltransferase family 39 protein [Anaerolineaceae bacterium]